MLSSWSDAVLLIRAALLAVNVVDTDESHIVYNVYAVRQALDNVITPKYHEYCHLHSANYSVRATPFSLLFIFGPVNGTLVDNNPSFSSLVVTQTTSQQPLLAPSIRKRRVLWLPLTVLYGFSFLNNAATACDLACLVSTQGLLLRSTFVTLL